MIDEGGEGKHPGAAPAAENAACQRRDPRYVETSADLSDWIRVRIARAFGSPLNVSGLLADLTPQAVRVALPDPECDPERDLAVGAKLLVTFRFRDLATLTAAVTVGRRDRLETGVAVVLFFDILTPEDRERVDTICRAYTARFGASERSGDPESGGKVP